MSSQGKDSGSSKSNNDNSKSSESRENSMTAGNGGKRSHESGEQQSTKKSRPEHLSTRQYLDKTVVPILLEGLAALSR